MDGTPNHKQFSYAAEIQRKIFHFLIIIFPVAYLYFGKKYFLYFLLPISAIIIAIDYYRYQNEKLHQIVNLFFEKIMRTHEVENGNLSGFSYTLISACLIFSFTPPAIAVASFLILAISDSLAAIIGRGIKSGPFYEKSIAGSATFFITAIIILISCGIHFNQWWTYYVFGFLAVFTATMLEARPSFLDLDDNLSIPLSFALVTYGFQLIWNYH